MDGILALDPELTSIKILNVYEMVRYLPSDMLLKDNSKMMNGIVPMVYLNRFNSGGLKKRAQKMWDFAIEVDKDLAKRNHGAIFTSILNEGLDSN
jgi:hypothetical protein